jgi:hypothetical protein
MAPDWKFDSQAGKSTEIIFTSALRDGRRMQTHMAPDRPPGLFRQGLSFVIYPAASGHFLWGLALGIMHLTNLTPPVWSAGGAVPTPTFSAAPRPLNQGLAVFTRDLGQG